VPVRRWTVAFAGELDKDQDNHRRPQER
jgi:hypothetical protein